jgi:hypothetical protein
MKKVTVTLKLDSEFIKFLNFSVQLGGLRQKREMTAIDQLALVVLGEARGALVEQIEEVICPTWRPHIEVLHDKRVVEEVS